jgi:hypothetical protein
MKKTLLLFLLLPFFGFAQIVDLAKWNAAIGNYTPTVNSNAVAANISGVGGATVMYTNNSGENVFYQTGSWPNPAQNGGAYDPTKYISLQITASANHKLDLSSLNFECRSEGNTNKFRIKYSKDPNFITGVKDLMTETVSTTNWTAFSPAFLPEINPVLPTQTVYIRIYVYSTYNNFQLKIGSVASNSGATIKGTVSNFDPNSILAINDYVTIPKNQASNINLINNDVKGSSNINKIEITTNPNSNEGTVAINPDFSITFNPAISYTGNTSFTYTITNSTQSSTATVYLTVRETSEENLALWNGAGSSFSPVTHSNVISDAITASGNVGLSYTNNSGSNIFFETSNWPKPSQNGGSFDPLKYITFKISPDQNHKIDLTTFSFSYKRNGNANEGQKFQVLYSKDAAFSTGVKTFVTGISSTNDWTASNNTFASDVSSILPTETMYIRLYVYNTNNNYHIQNGNGNDVGPVIRGYVRDISTLTAYNDTATTISNQSVVIRILDNDTNGYVPLQSITVSQPPVSAGSVVVNGLNNVTFTPAAGFVGTTTFVYTLYNGDIYSSARVTVTVTAPPCIANPTPGMNKWNGYVYTYTGNTPETTTYVGSIFENPIFDRNVGDGNITGDPTAGTDNFCGTIPNDRFYVRYLMQASTAAGTYNITIGGDDGVRLYIDNILVPLTPSESWADHGYTRYAAQYTLAAGSHNFVLEYYEKAGLARVSFSYGAVQGTSTSLPFGDNKWNVYGFTLPGIDLESASYAGTYVDPKLNIDTQTYWDKTKSPSYYSGWQGAPITVDDFAITYKRRGFPCGRYQLDLANCDDVAKILINGVEIFTQNGYSPDNIPVTPGTVYFLNESSTVEVRLREDAGNANVALNFTDTPTVYNGTGTFSPNTTSIKISSNTILNNDMEVCSCTIDPNVVLTVPANKTLTINQNITIGAGGKLILQNNGSLLQTSTNADAYTGASDSFVVQRNTAPVRRYDFTFWSSPVNRTPGFTLYDLSPDTLFDKYYSFNPATGWVISYSGILPMTPGSGYIVRAPQTFDITGTAIYPATFVGKPNNGTIEVTGAIVGKSILLGNPYPSALNATKFINDNHALGTDVGALYFWTHNSPPSSAVAGDGKYNYTTADYAVFSLTGSVATSKGATTTGYNTAPSGMIASGQAFFTRPTSTGKITFTNNMRVPANNNQFFKNTNDADKNRLWLNLTNAQGAFKQTLIGYLDGATNNWDVNYDGVSISGNAFVDFYSINDAKKLTVQGRALPFDNSDVVELGYVTTVAGDFTIEIDHADGFFDTQAVYLEDKTTGKITDLRAANYTFTTAIGTFTDRFSLRYTNKTLGTGDFENIENGLLVSVKEKTIKITSAKEAIKEVTLFDINGKQLHNKNKIASTEVQLSNIQAPNQVLLVKVTLENDYVVTKKIILQ